MELVGSSIFPRWGNYIKMFSWSGNSCIPGVMRSKEVDPGYRMLQQIRSSVSVGHLFLELQECLKHYFAKDPDRWGFHVSVLFTLWALYVPYLCYWLHCIPARWLYFWLTRVFMKFLFIFFFSLFSFFYLSIVCAVGLIHALANLTVYVFILSPTCYQSCLSI